MAFPSSRVGRYNAGSRRLISRQPNGKGFILSPGPLVPQDIGQAKKEQFYHILSLQNRSIQKVPMRVRKYIFLDGTSEQFDLKIALSTLRNPFKLPVAVLVKMKPNQSLPKDIPEGFIVVSEVVFGRVNTTSVHTVEASLDDAVKTEIETTEKENMKLMNTLYSSLKMSEAPDEVLQTVLEKWGVVQG